MPDNSSLTKPTTTLKEELLQTGSLCSLQDPKQDSKKMGNLGFCVPSVNMYCMIWGISHSISVPQIRKWTFVSTQRAEKRAMLPNEIQKAKALGMARAFGGCWAFFSLSEMVYLKFRSRGYMDSLSLWRDVCGLILWFCGNLGITHYSHLALITKQRK